MKKVFNLIILLLIALVFTGCHASVLMNNGEITAPQGGGPVSKDPVEEFDDKTPPANVNATASFYTDKIMVRWNKVKGADYYRIEKTSHNTPEIPENANWVDLGVAVQDTGYEDHNALQPSVYYSYRITPYTFIGAKGAVSAPSTGTILTSPVNIDASKGSDIEHIFITWDQTPNVEEYIIYKSNISSITGSESEYVTTVEALEGEVKNTYAYPVVKGKEEGKEIFFAISASCNDTVAKVSLPRSGFSRVLGAPQKPVALISKGEFTNKIVVQFLSPSEDASSPYDYVIKRSYPGSTEAEVFSTKFGDKLVQNENGYYVFEDTDVYDNLEYTYSIMAVNNEDIKSEAVVETGYVLSPVKSLELKAEERGSEIGYKAFFELPVGFDNANYVYKVTTILKNGSAGPAIDIPSKDIKSADLFYKVLENPTVAEEKEEVKSVSIAVSNGTYDSNAVVSNSAKNLDYAITNIEATHNDKPLPGDEPNELGVYPVHIKFETQSTFEQTLIRKGSDGSISYISVSNKEYTDTDTLPLVTYDYYIDNTDDLGRTIGGNRGEILHANSDKGNKSYGSVTKELYKAMFESISLKPWDKQEFVPTQYRSWWKSTKLAIMIGYGNAPDLATQMKALGDAEANDHSTRSGKVRYSAAMEGVGGQIYFYYTNFGENENFYMNGEYEMHVNASGNGSAGSKSNGFTIMGMYPGHCSLSGINVSSKQFVGTYRFKYEYNDGSVVDMEIGV